jgi:Flp pilus assembly pilin Flp
MTMRMALTALWSRDDGQDTIEYTLLIAFVTFTAAALFIFGMGGSLKGIWGSGSSRLSTANTMVS